MTLSRPVFARVYQRLSVVMERGGVGDLRRRLLAGLSGRVIEIGAGNGLNFGHYPAAVTEVVAVEPEPHLRRAALSAAAAADVPVRVVAGVAASLPDEDGTFDAAVASLVLCSVPDQAAALRELQRVLRPGGEFRFLEHVRSRRPALARVQRAADVLWPCFAGGCHTSRDTVGAIEAAGFVLERLDRFRFPPGRVFVPAAPHVLGVARRPG